MRVCEEPRVGDAFGELLRTVAVLVVDAAAMARDGHAFYRSANGVWLTDSVPPEYLSGYPISSSA